MKSYPIAESDRKHAGNSISAVRIGETRQPKAGEWFLSGAAPEAYQAPNDLKMARSILRLVEVPLYCEPANAGLSSETAAVARRIGRLFDALDNEVSKLVVGSHDRILQDIEAFRTKLRERLEAEGWTVGYTNGLFEPCDRCRVYPPGNPTGKKIRKWRASR